MYKKPENKKPAANYLAGYKAGLQEDLVKLTINSGKLQEWEIRQKLPKFVQQYAAAGEQEDNEVIIDDYDEKYAKKDDIILADAKSTNLLSSEFGRDFEGLSMNDPKVLQKEAMEQRMTGLASQFTGVVIFYIILLSANEGMYIYAWTQQCTIEIPAESCPNWQTGLIAWGCGIVLWLIAYLIGLAALAKFIPYLLIGLILFGNFGMFAVVIASVLFMTNLQEDLKLFLLWIFAILLYSVGATISMTIQVGLLICQMKQWLGICDELSVQQQLLPSHQKKARK